MAESTTAKKSTRTTGRASTAKRSTATGLTAEERAAMKAYLKEQKAAAQGADMLRELLDRIAEMPAGDRSMAKRVHEIVTAAAPSLEPRTWYGMPAYAKDGKVICFFQSAAKFKARYATFGFSDAAKLDIGAMWPTSYALTKLTAADEKRIAALVKKAVS
ncbi:MAG: iron chaperone [Actinomycetota bacterium]